MPREGAGAKEKACFGGGVRLGWRPVPVWITATVQNGHGRHGQMGQLPGGAGREVVVAEVSGSERESMGKSLLG
jgi:hypothetical protein